MPLHYHLNIRKVFIARVGHWNADSGFTLKDTYVPDIFLLEQALDDDESQVSYELNSYIYVYYLMQRSVSCIAEPCG